MNETAALKSSQRKIGGSILFLSWIELAHATKRVVGAQGLRCAVAYWGVGAADFITSAGGKVEDAKILCDISGGSTNPEALVELKAPGNGNLRRYDRLHAKVYISDAGMVVGSPNATANGLGFHETPSLLEAGTFHEAGSTAWQAAIAWFDGLHDRAKSIDAVDLAEAKRRWRPAPRTGEWPVRAESLLDRVCRDPNDFGPVGFVFVRGSAPPDQVAEARTSAARKAVSFETAPNGDFFTQWPKETLERWPMLFVEFWISPKGNLTVYGRRVQCNGHDEGYLIADSKWSYVRGQLPDDTPAKEKIELHDADLAKRLFGKGPGVMFPSAPALAIALLELSASSEK